MYTVSTTGTVLELMDLVLFSEAPANILAADYVSGNIISSPPPPQPPAALDIEIQAMANHFSLDCS